LIFFVVTGHKDGGKQISHSSLTGKLVPRFKRIISPVNVRKNLAGEMLALENK